MRVGKPLIWLDLETTGVNPLRDKILQVCCFITNGDLSFQSSPFEKIVSSSEECLQKMDATVRDMHQRTGLWQKCLESTEKIEKVDQELHGFISKHVTAKTGVLAGSSVHFDKFFLHVHCPQTTEYLHHRILDVSSIHEIGRRHNPNLMRSRPKKDYRHEAKSDILESIQELKWYRENYLVGAK